MNREVERKFFFQPEKWKGRRTKSTSLEQGYLPNTGDWEIRLRRSASEYRYTMKSGSGLDRGEWEVKLSGAEFEALWPRTDGLRISKIRDRHAWKAFDVEVDHYGAALAGLVVAEVEFSSQAQARSFAPPEAFGPELTYDPRFKNRSLAAGGAVPLAAPLAGSSGWSFGVLPYRKGIKGWEMILVSTRRADRWIFPKGQPEPNMSFEKVALAEAREEGGLTGVRAGHPLVLPYVRETGTTNLLLFPLKVTAMAARWQEEGQRTRRVVSLEEAQEFGDLAQLGALWIENQAGM